CHLLSLPLQRTLAGADLLGEVLGDVGAEVGWSGGSADRSGGLFPRRSQLPAAGVAELLAGGVGGAAARTRRRADERRCATSAESRFRWVGVTAAWTVHIGRDEFGRGERTPVEL